MANESQYYAPIIQAMIASYQKQQQAAELEQRRVESKAAVEHQKAQEAEVQRQLDLHQQQIDDEHKHWTESLANEAKHIGILADQAKLNAYKTSNEMSAAGLNLGKVAPQLSGMLGGGQGQPPIDFSAFQTPAGEAQMLQQQAAAKAQGELPAQMSLLKQRQQGEGDLQYQEQQFKSSLADKEIGSKERMGHLERDTQMAMNNATNATHLRVAGMDPTYTPNKDTLRAMQVAFATGQSKPNLANPLERAAFASNQELGMRDFDPKDAEALKQSQALLPLFDKLRGFADKLPSSRSGAFIQGKALGTANAIGWPTKTQNDLNNINSQAIQVGKAVEGLTGGRLSNTQLELDLKALASGGIPKEDAVSRINNLQDLYTNKQENMLMGGMTPVQKDLIYKTYGLKPSWLVTAPKVNVKGHQLDEENSIKLGQPVYSQQQ